MCPAITVLGAGLAYNKDHFASPPTSWNDLFRKDLKGRPGYPVLSQSYSPLVMTRIAELHGGGIDDIGKGMARLAAIKDRVQLFRIFEILKAINQGDASIAPMLNIFVRKDPKVPLSFAWPKDGGVGVVNLACVLKASENKAVAEQFLNFYLSAEHQARIAREAGDSPVNKTVPDAGGYRLQHGDAGPDLADAPLRCDQDCGQARRLAQAVPGRDRRQDRDRRVGPYRLRAGAGSGTGRCPTSRFPAYPNGMTISGR